MSETGRPRGILEYGGPLARPTPRGKHLGIAGVTVMRPCWLARHVHHSHHRARVGVTLGRCARAWPADGLVVSNGAMSDVPLRQHAFLSDCGSAGLVTAGGSVDWLCLPRFDSPSVFARLLDESGGHFLIAPT